MDVRFPNIRHLRVFLEVARSHSISMAASRAHLSQPAVTQAVSNLEHQLGIQLFQRKNVGFHTTEIGALFMLRVSRALELLKTGARSCLAHSKSEKSAGFSNFDELITAAQLRAIVAVSEAQNFSIAAANLGLSQPSVHRSARNLESLSGVRFFERSSSGITPTIAAQAFIRFTKLAYAEITQGLDEISVLNGMDTTTITVGSLPLARTHILPLAVNEMIQSTNGVQVNVIDGPYATHLQRLRSGDIDCIIGALREPIPAEDIVQERLFSDPLAIVAAHNHPLVGKAALTLEDALAYPWVAPPKNTPAGRYLFEKLQIQERKKTPVRAVSSSLVFLRGLLAQGEYLTIISRHQISEEVRQGLLVPLPIALNNSERPIGITFRKDWRPTETQSKFVDLLRKYGAYPPRTEKEK